LIQKPKVANLLNNNIKLMRLTQEQIQIIKETTQRFMGERTRVFLFGSRTSDINRGGDIDLLVETDECLPNRVQTLCQLEAALLMRLGDRKLDIVFKDPQSILSPIHEVAKRTGIQL
jgi:predicted nucleotidyltransferase